MKIKPENVLNSRKTRLGKKSHRANIKRELSSFPGNNSSKSLR